MPRIVKALPNKILAEMVDNYGQEKITTGGIILQDKDATETSIRPRWFRVVSLGEGIDWISEGQYIMVDHGRWSKSLKLDDELSVHLIDNKDCLAVVDHNPMEDDNIEIGLLKIRQRPAGDTTRGL